MVEEQLKPRGINDEKVLAAMLAVAREDFTPPALKNQAYDDCALPIGHGQTISQPYIVAKMTQLLQLTGQEKVLDIGTGSGYQAAILAEIVSPTNVFSIERLAEVAAQAKKNLAKAGYGAVNVRTGNGLEGWPSEAPFDRIIIGAEAAEAPDKLKQQLKINGLMVLPLRNDYAVYLTVVTREAEDEFSLVRHDPCMFVPLVG